MEILGNTTLSGPEEITNFNTQVEEQKELYTQQISAYTLGLNYGSVCCDDASNLRNFQRRLNILDNYDTRDIYNCTPASTTFDEEQLTYVSYPVDEGYPDLIGRVVFSSLTPGAVTYLSINNEDLYGNTSTPFAEGNLMRVQISPTTYVVYIVRSIQTYLFHTIYTVSFISSLSSGLYSNYVNNNTVKISKVNLYSKPYEYQDAASPSTIGKFTASPGGGSLLVTNITNLRIHKVPLGETDSSWLDMFSLGDKLLITGVKTDFTDTSWGLFTLSIITDYTNFKRFDFSTLSGYGSFATSGQNYTISKITSIITTIPEECTQDTTIYNNLTYTEIKNLLNS